MKIQSENSTRKLSIYTEILNKLMEHNNIAALSVMIDQLGPQSQVHGPRTADEDDAKYLLVLRSLSKVISMFSREQLQEYIAFLCRLGIMHVNSEEIQLRQASILLLSELYLPLKDSIFPYIELLSVTQRKLLMIYVEKKKGQSLSEHPQMRSAVDI